MASEIGVLFSRSLRINGSRCVGLRGGWGCEYLRVYELPSENDRYPSGISGGKPRLQPGQGVPAPPHWQPSGQGRSRWSSQTQRAPWQIGQSLNGFHCRAV